MEKINQKNITISLFILGIVGLAAFVFQLGYVLAACEVVCLAGFVWLLFSKRIAVRTLPLLVVAILFGALVFNPVAMGSVTGLLWPDSTTAPEELPIIARFLLFRRQVWYYRTIDALTGLCLAAIALPWFKHLAEKRLAVTTVVMAVLCLLTVVLGAVDFEIGVILGVFGSAYCVTLMVIDLITGKKEKPFGTIFLSCLSFSVSMTLLVALLIDDYIYGNILFDILLWVVAFTFPLCSALLYLVWYSYKQIVSKKV